MLGEYPFTYPTLGITSVFRLIQKYDWPSNHTHTHTGKKITRLDETGEGERSGEREEKKMDKTDRHEEGQTHHTGDWKWHTGMIESSALAIVVNTTRLKTCAMGMRVSFEVVVQHRVCWCVCAHIVFTNTILNVVVVRV